MLHQSKAFSSFSVNDVAKAKIFYGDILKIETSENDMGILTLHLAGGQEIIIYPKGDQHQPASFTVLNFVVEDIDAAVEALTSANISLEQYDGDINTDEKGISRGDRSNGYPDIAWFKDPAGNILSVVQPNNAH